MSRVLAIVGRGARTEFGVRRERANLGPRQPERLSAMRKAFEAWEATMPPIPEDASVSLGYGLKDMPQR